MAETIASVKLDDVQSGEPEGMQWSPVPGPELQSLLTNKLGNNQEAVAKVAASARAILGRGLPPDQLGSDTGLVVGYVQSGKTLSFTAVMALARDNGYQLVIVIAGSSTQLTDQSDKRLRKDLHIGVDGKRAWTPYLNPRPSDTSGIEDLLDEARDDSVPRSERPTVLVTVMKQHTHLRNLASSLAKMNLHGISALIIDDEADQASLNTQAQQNSAFGRVKKSSTYRRLMDLRQALPSHTYIQYTATPQAPLLISIIDSLSARWVDVLEPGAGYAGGITFFGPPRDRGGRPPAARPAQEKAIVRAIPANEIPSSQQVLASAPESLQRALRLFMIGVSAGLASGEGSGSNRSMLVHPSTRTADHQTYWMWINDLLSEWRSAFRKKDNDSEELAETFREDYLDLAASVGPAIPSFEIVKNGLLRAVRNTEMREVNRRQGGPVLVDWGQRYGWILVGGLALDRGFTVEGLTVTYMPRGMGGGNADSMQQRARFFGYKRGYLGYCRVFLASDTKAGFEDYVEHEEFMRNDLAKVRDSTDGLRDWPRRFVLDPTLSPCRDNVLSDSYSRGAAEMDSWVVPQAFMGFDQQDPENLNVVSKFLECHSGLFYEDEGHPSRFDSHRHLASSPLPLREVLDELITRYRVRDPGEAEEWTTLGAMLGRMLEQNENAQAVIYQMSPGEQRTRTISKTGRVKQLFQGAYPVNPPASRGSVYAGDNKIFVPGVLTVQVHHLNIRTETEGVIAQRVPFLAVKLPSNTGLLPIVTQAQSAQEQGSDGAS